MSTFISLSNDFPTVNWGDPITVNRPTFSCIREEYRREVLVFLSMLENAIDNGSTEEIEMLRSNWRELKAKRATTPKVVEEIFNNYTEAAAILKVCEAKIETIKASVQKFLSPKQPRQLF